jgi:prepilin-type N-terminal cleavage/methylation domain-containing protein
MPFDGVKDMSEVPAGKKLAGFTLQEVLVVVAIGLIVTLAAVPVMSNAIANMRLRSSLTSVSGLLQNTRAIAVQQNKNKTACHFNVATAPYSLVYFVKDATDCTTATLLTADPQVELEAPITPYGAPTGTGAPTALDNTTQLGVTTAPLTTDPSFNSRGLPCTYASGSCTPNVSFVQYYKDNRISGSGGWAAISVSPAGRIKRWFWNGSSWTG